MKNAYRLNTFLAAVTGLAFLGYLLIQTYSPAAILPPVDLMMVSGLSLLALVLESYSGPRVERRVWPMVALLAGVGVAVGDPSGAFLPQEALTRESALLLAVRMSRLEP